ncbi:hypothetical protein EMCRGX_G026877 [Ephydatia muelleri]
MKVCLKTAYTIWVDVLCAPEWIVDLIRQGYVIPFYSKPTAYTRTNQQSAWVNTGFVDLAVAAQWGYVQTWRLACMLHRVVGCQEKQPRVLQEGNWWQCLDQFADNYNAQLDRFNSCLACPGMEAVDTFTVHWGEENNWLCPPPPGLVVRVIRHAEVLLTTVLSSRADSTTRKYLGAFKRWKLWAEARQGKAFQCSLSKKSTWYSYLQYLEESVELRAAKDEAVQALVPGCIRWLVCHQWGMHH